MARTIGADEREQGPPMDMLLAPMLVARQAGLLTDADTWIVLVIVAVIAVGTAMWRRFRKHVPPRREHPSSFYVRQGVIPKRQSSRRKKRK
jgi:positive regulator of sigma E activity